MKKLTIILLIIAAAAASSGVPAAAVETAMIPYSGTHGLVQHRFNKGYRGGTATGLRFTKRGLAIAPGSAFAGMYGEYISAEIRTKFPANELVMTWNSDMPQGAWMSIQFRVRAKQLDWSEWYDMGQWGAAAAARPRNASDSVYGPLKVDQLAATTNFDFIQYRIEFYSSSGEESSALRLISLSYSHVGAGEADSQLMRAAGGRSVSLAVPWISQLRPEDVEDEALRKAGVCAPTSITMVSNFLGRRTRVSETARRGFDPVANIFGNWAFLVAVSGDFGFDAWVQRFNNWAEVRRFIESGTPVIISIAYEKGTFEDYPEKFSKGHLMVVRGFTKSGDVIVNDPGTAHEEMGKAFTFRWEELGVAFFGHGGVGIVLSKQL